MKPVLATAEMAAVDAAAPEPVAELIDRAGAAIARAALTLLGGSYGRRVVVVAGKGHNGDDGRVAGDLLAARGVRVSVVPAEPAPAPLQPCDLVVDAAYGTGFRGVYQAPEPPAGVPVLAVDIPSGVNGDTGEACAAAVRATATVTFAAYKPGLLLGEGPARAGDVTVADIGLRASGAHSFLVEDADVHGALPARRRDGHKWDAATYVVAGSPGMMGSALLCSRAALRAGSGMVRLGVPAADPSSLPASEVVAAALPSAGWDPVVAGELARCKVLVMGPGIGRGPQVRAAVRGLVVASPVPVVLDADALAAVSPARELRSLVGTRDCPVVVTPHDGEFELLAGAPPGTDRIAATRALAAETGAAVLLKGPTTVVAAPGGDAWLAAAGSPRLATAGTGDVLSGMIGAFIAQGADPPLAAALAAHVHGRAAALGPGEGLVAGDLPALVSRWLSGDRLSGDRPYGEQAVR